MAQSRLGVLCEKGEHAQAAYILGAPHLVFGLPSSSAADTAGRAHGS